MMHYDYEVIENGDYASAIQQIINDGTAWKFHGSVGRAMMNAIEAGMCMLGKQPVYDYYGNRIPSRYEVQAGTKGSYEYVANTHGTEYADAIAAL